MEPFWMEAPSFCAGPAPLLPKKEERVPIKTLKADEHAHIEKALETIHSNRMEILATKRLYQQCLDTIKKIGEDFYIVRASTVHSTQITLSQKFEFLSTLNMSCDRAAKVAIESLPTHESTVASLQAKFDKIEATFRLELKKIEGAFRMGIQQAEILTRVQSSSPLNPERQQFITGSIQIAKPTAQEKKVNDNAMSDG